MYCYECVRCIIVYGTCKTGLIPFVVVDTKFVYLSCTVGSGKTALVLALIKRLAAPSRAIFPQRVTPKIGVVTNDNVGVPHFELLNSKVVLCAAKFNFTI